MGVDYGITATTFPKQGDYLGKRTRVLFHYRAPELRGTIVRDDREQPFRTIIRLDDGRYVLADECQYAPELIAAAADAPEGEK
jgi:hypothetical protein